MAQTLTDTQARSWARTGLLKDGDERGAPAVPRRTFSENLGRGAGSMLLERRTSGVIEVYLLLRRDGKQQRRKLGAYDELNEYGQRCGLAYWRREAVSVAAELRQFSTLEAYDEHQRRTGGG